MQHWKKFIVLILIGLFIFIAAPALGEHPQKAYAAGEQSSLLQNGTYINPTINMKFSPISIVPGGISRLTVELFNPNETVLTAVDWQNILNDPDLGIEIAENPDIVNTCGGTVSAVPGSNLLGLTGGSVAAKEGTEFGQCRVVVSVTSFTPGNLDNEIPAGALTAYIGEEELTNPTGAKETLNVASVDAPSVSKQFNPNSIWYGEQSQLRIIIRNNDSSTTLTQVALTDQLPEGLVIGDPVIATAPVNCGEFASISATTGLDQVTITDGQIAANQNCYFTINVTGEEGLYSNVIPADSVETFQRVTNPLSATAPLRIDGVRILKAFDPVSFLAGEEQSLLTLTIQNPFNLPLTNVSLSDILPGADLVYVTDTAQPVVTTCEAEGAPASYTFSNENQTLLLENMTVPAGVSESGTLTPGECTIQVVVTAPATANGATETNSIPAETLTSDEGYTNSNPASAIITIRPQSIEVEKTFNPIRFELNGTTIIRIILTNPTSVPVTGVTLQDNLPEGLIPVVGEQAFTNTNCGGGGVSLSTDPSYVELSNGTIPANGTCYFEARITTTAESLLNDTVYTNIIPPNAITSNENITNHSSEQEDVVVYPTTLGVVAQKTFQTNNQPTNTNVTVRIRLTAPEDQSLTGVDFFDQMPEGLTITGITSATGCGAAPTIDSVNQRVVLTGGSISANSSCVIDFTVQGDLPGTYENTIYSEDFTSDQGQTFPNDRSATLSLSDLRTSKSFFPTRINAGGRSTLTITLYNDNANPMVDLGLQDRLSTMGAGFVVADPPNASTTCGGVLTANLGDDTVTLSAGQLPGNSQCTIKVDIFAQESVSQGNKTNRISQTDAQSRLDLAGQPLVNARNSSTATLTIANMKIDLVKNFDPSSVFGGAASRLSVLLINRNPVPMIDIAFEDPFPAGMEIAQPAQVDTSTCGGTVEFSPDGQGFLYSGGYLAANRRCTISMNVIIRVNQNLTNTIEAGAVSTFIGTCPG